MEQKALGLIEVIGLVPALEAADACLKAANVQFVGYETVTPGLVTVKIQGDIGAVQAAIAAGKVSAARIGTVVSSLVIPRPAPALNYFHQMVEKQSKKKAVSEEKPYTNEPELVEQTVVHSTEAVIQVIEEGSLEQDSGSMNSSDSSEHRTEEASCNLCNDPACEREKGQPRTQCLHYKEQKVVLG
ncbi:BMC domain-containing protein [Neobacillus niacini]|uniref:BMC domain-containing protein n=1 Tax=Neobacillus niacini TaxID=86668 RepID=UPI002559D501|nr:BMC domain-containing protein [Neobacillus niacini]